MAYGAQSGGGGGKNIYRHLMMKQLGECPLA